MSFKQALQQERPLQLVGVINAYVAIMAKKIGFKALYLSGAGVANSSYGLPDLGITSLDNVLEDVRRIVSAANLPLIVDVDTGWGSYLNVQRTILMMEAAGAAGVHIEDQQIDKRCGHREGKKIVPTEEMLSRLDAAVHAKKNKEFVIIARTDAYASEGLEGTIERGVQYKNAGADILFPEALKSLEEFKLLKQAVQIPLLANMTEFGKTPLYSLEELKNAGVDIVLYPLTINRLMNFAAKVGLTTLRKEGSQKNLLNAMQTRDELYDFLDYLSYEQLQGGK